MPVLFTFHISTRESSILCCDDDDNASDDILAAVRFGSVRLVLFYSGSRNLLFDYYFYFFIASCAIFFHIFFCFVLDLPHVHKIQSATKHLFPMDQHETVFVMRHEKWKSKIKNYYFTHFCCQPFGKLIIASSYFIIIDRQLLSVCVEWQLSFWKQQIIAIQIDDFYEQRNLNPIYKF